MNKLALMLPLLALATAAIADTTATRVCSGAKSGFNRLEFTKMEPQNGGDGGWTMRVCGVCRLANDRIIECPRVDGGFIGQCDECEIGPAAGAQSGRDECAQAWKNERCG